jgi:hypothetical protein
MKKVMKAFRPKKTLGEIMSLPSPNFWWPKIDSLQKKNIFAQGQKKPHSKLPIWRVLYLRRDVFVGLSANTFFTDCLSLGSQQTPKLSGWIFEPYAAL